MAFLLTSQIIVIFTRSLSRIDRGCHGQNRFLNCFSKNAGTLFFRFYRIFFIRERTQLRRGTTTGGL